jgi:predicted metal-binding protein
VHNMRRPGAVEGGITVENIFQIKPVIEYSVRGLCVRPYQGHLKGCPNFGKKKGCPPGALKFDEVYDLSKPVFAIINKFDFLDHTNKMRRLHPGWTERQVRCCLYWQTTARNQLLHFIRQFKNFHSGYSIETCPEAMGVNITATMANVDVMLEWPPETVTYQIALAGVKRSGGAT